jgi:hypothetical protein
VDLHSHYMGQAIPCDVLNMAAAFSDRYIQQQTSARVLNLDCSLHSIDEYAHPYCHNRRRRHVIKRLQRMLKMNGAKKGLRRKGQTERNI